MIKIVKSLAMIALVGAVALGITGAYFSDTEKSTDNTFTAGKLDLTVNGQITPGPVVEIDDMKPCDIKYSKPIELEIDNNPGRVFKHIKKAECDTGVIDYECVLPGGKVLEVTNDAECDEILEDGLLEDPNDLPSYIHFNLEEWIGPESVPETGGPLCEDVSLEENCWKMIIREDKSKTLYEDYTSCWIPVAEFGEPMVVNSIIIRQSFHLDKDVTNWAQGDHCVFEEEFMVLQMNDETEYPVNPDSNRVWDPTQKKCVDM